MENKIQGTILGLVSCTILEKTEMTKFYLLLSNIGEYAKAVYCHPAYLTYMQKKHKLESRLLGEISTTSDMQMTPPLWQKVKN